MAVIQFPFCHSPIGNLKIFTKFLAIHASAFPQFFYFGFAVHFIYPIKQKYTLRIYYSIRQTNTQRVNLIYIKRLCQIPDTQERVAFPIPQNVCSQHSQSPASAPIAADHTSATAAPSHQHSGQTPHYISDHHKLCSIGRSFPLWLLCA